MPQDKDKKKKNTNTRHNKKIKANKKPLKKKLHPKKKPPVHSTKPKYYKKYVKSFIQPSPTPIPTHHDFIKNDNSNDDNSTNSVSSFSSSSIFSSHTSSISYYTPTTTSKNNLTVVSETQHLNPPDTTSLNNAGRSSTTSTPNAIHDTNQTMKIAGPIIGIIGGIVLTAALVLVTIRYKNRRRSETEIKKDIDEDQYKSSFESNGGSDEDKTKRLYHSEKKSNSPSYNNKPFNLVSINKTEKKRNENDLQRRFSVTDTLVDSQIASRPNSVSLKVAGSAVDISQKQALQYGTRISWQSVSSSLLSDTISPTSTLIGTTTTSFMKTAERQLLHHERPSILDHFDGQFKKNIETYKAQLSDISSPLGRIDEQEGQLNDDI